VSRKVVVESRKSKTSSAYLYGDEE